MKNIGWNSEEIRVELVEPNRAKGKRDIRVDGRLWDVCDHSNQVDWPHMVVFDGAPESGRCYGLSIMHVALRGVIAENSIGHNGDFTITEPSFWSEPGLGLNH